MKDGTNIFSPEIYHGREDEPGYGEIATQISIETSTALIKERAEHDGQWSIDNGFVGDNEDKMRRMIEFVSDPKMIAQAISHPSNAGRTVDYICRDLANASKFAANAG